MSEVKIIGDAVKNMPWQRICLLQLRRDKPPLDGPLPELRQLEYYERGCGR